jgi:hypothetical protein
MFCPICLHKDKSCRVRYVNEHPLYSCRSCFEREEQRQRRSSRPATLTDPLEELGYRSREPSGCG